MSDGQLAMNTNLASPGLFFKDSNGDSVKIGPVHVGTTAPNATPGAGGQAGNSVGEQWLDTTGGRFVFKIWDGTAFRTEDGEFVNATGDTMTGALIMDNQQQVRFRETTANGTNFIAIQAPASVAADRTLTLPDVTGTVVSTGDTGTVTSTMILDGTIADTKLATISTAGKVSGTAITSGAIDTTGNITISNATPIVRLEETGGTATHNRTLLIRSSDTFTIRTRDSADANVSTDYLIDVAATGASSHRWQIANAEEARLNATGLGLGTISPSFRLEVARLGADQAITGVDANTAVLVTAGGGTTSSGAAITIAGGTASLCSVFFGDTANGDIGAVIYDNATDSMLLRTNATTKATITSAGQLRLAGAGITFNGDSAAVNELDDYEEGSFTPVIIGTTTAGTGTYSSQVGRYTKIGRTVSFTIRLVWSAHTGTGSLRINGLPFNNAAINVPVSLRINALTSPASTVVQAHVISSQNDIAFEDVTVATGIAGSLAMDTSADLMVNGTYSI